jgi:hypothetical protein
MIPSDSNRISQTRSADYKADSTEDKNRVPPNSKKDFKQVMEGREEKSIVLPEKDKKKKLASTTANRKVSKERDEDDEEELGRDTSPLTLFASQTKKTVKAPTKDVSENSSLDTEEGEEEVAEAERTPQPKVTATPKESLKEETESVSSNIPLAEEKRPPSMKSGTSKTKEGTSYLNKERPDLSQVNPLGGNSPTQVASLTEGKGFVESRSNATSIKEVIDRITKEILTLEQNGKTDTVVILQNPPRFKDARLVLTSFDSAKKEFNISFENLTQEAQRLLADNLHALKNSLEEKGYAAVVHMMTATTLIEHPIPSDAQKSREESREQNPRERGDEESPQQQQRNRNSNPR